jgi:hypothetical protein
VPEHKVAGLGQVLVQLQARLGPGRTFAEGRATSSLSTLLLQELLMLLDGFHRLLDELGSAFCILTRQFAFSVFGLRFILL